MDKKQARQFLNMKLQTRVNEAKCKALINDKLLSNLFSQDIQQMHYETIHKKLEMAYAMKKLSYAHNRYLAQILQQYSSAIKSNKSLLSTINGHLTHLMDREKDLLELREETILGVKDAMDVEINSVLEDEEQTWQNDLSADVSYLLPPTPTHTPTPEVKRKLTFGNVFIKTIDEVESEKQESNEHEYQTFTENNISPNINDMCFNKDSTQQETKADSFDHVFSNETDSSVTQDNSDDMNETTIQPLI
jgi:uncharacterized damage-inducible protein DinB